MANRAQLLTPPPRTYTRTEFAALRAWVQGVPAATLARQYLEPAIDAADDAEDPNANPERFLRAMRDDLVRLTILHGSPVLAEHLKASITRHGHARLGAASLKLVEQAARLAVAVPAPAHAVGLWFRPLVAQRLAGGGIATLADLVNWINARGPTWWRALPCIGLGRARTLVAWLRWHEGSLGLAVDADVREDAPPDLAVAVTERIELALAGQGDRVERRLVPLERMALPQALSGAQGSNRAAMFPYVRAPRPRRGARLSGRLCGPGQHPACLPARTWLFLPIPRKVKISRQPLPGKGWQGAT
ncbi:phage integrase family protein [Cupriavidus sp. CV2]|uniref:phage integrase family protein n=1 Tax=Cupriavidus ulmosensis TaxID=3065913 RepID=UPI00296B506F|nr:phage integrase family protein [Cupriavidus sp. CV2]MDW3688600.1 phage integrase family protein [Cupriavidus sp. CV2]